MSYAPHGIQEMVQLFSQYPEIEEVLIFESRTKGNDRKGSDVDCTADSDLLGGVTPFCEQKAIPIIIEISD